MRGSLLTYGRPQVQPPPRSSSTCCTRWAAASRCTAPPQGSTRERASICSPHLGQALASRRHRKPCGSPLRPTPCIGKLTRCMRHCKRRGIRRIHGHHRLWGGSAHLVQDGDAPSTLLAWRVRAPNDPRLLGRGMAWIVAPVVARGQPSDSSDARRRRSGPHVALPAHGGVDQMCAFLLAFPFAFNLLSRSGYRVACVACWLRRLAGRRACEVYYILSPGRARGLPGRQWTWSSRRYVQI
jgi:hypothetical protein